MTAALEKPETPTVDPAVMIGTRRAELTDEIARLRRERGAAWADGGSVDHNALAVAEAELAMLEDAEGEIVRRSSDKAETERLARRDMQARRMTNLAGEWLSQIDETEALARSFVASLKAEEVRRAEIQTLCFALFGSAHTTLDREVQTDRRSRSLAALFFAMEGKGAFGAITLPSFLVGADEAWSAAERQAVEAINEQLKGTASDEN